jgi:cytochrome c oxidase subunit IV
MSHAIVVMVKFWILNFILRIVSYLARQVSIYFVQPQNIK